MTPKLQALIAYDHPNIRSAYFFATAAHGAVGQMRPTLEDPNVPYIVHPVEVAGIVAEVEGATVEMVVAALLHDVVEDTGVKITTIERLFGLMVGGYVMHMTDYYTPERFPGLNRDARKRLEATRISLAPAAVKTIKLADGLSNTPSIAINKPKFMPVYGPEKRAAWRVLKGGDEGLWIKLDEELLKWGY
jgi:(p)ppGpp synthase/HD superfamily hydrolase